GSRSDRRQTQDARLRRPHEAAHHRAASRDDRPGHGARRPGRARSAVPGAAHCDPHRRHAVGWQRQRLQLLLRPRHRPRHEAHAGPTPRHRRSHSARSARVRLDARGGLDRRPRGLHDVARGGSRGGGDLLLRRHLHAHPQAPHPAEHRVGRHRRLHAGAHRLGRRHRLAQLGARHPLRHRLPLDTAALLAALDALQGRLRGRRGADARRRARPHRRGAAGRALRLGDRRVLAARHPARPDGRRLHGARGALGRLVPHRVAPPLRRGDPPRRGEADACVPREHHLPDARVHRRRRRPAPVRADPGTPPVTLRTPLGWAAERWELGPRALRWGTSAALVTAILIVLGGVTVRVTGSGLGCPTWPTCTEDSLIATPELGIHGAIEFGNRLITGLLVVAVGWAIIAARLQRPRDRMLTRLAWSMFWLVVANAVAGGFTVWFELNPWMVATHFLLAMTLLACATFTWHRARWHGGEGPRPSAASRATAWGLVFPT